MFDAPAARRKPVLKRTTNGSSRRKGDTNYDHTRAILHRPECPCCLGFSVSVSGVLDSASRQYWNRKLGFR